jgi:hypothetical protein
MFRPAHLVLLIAGIGASAAAQQRSLGVFGLWGSFQDASRCYAIAQPVESSIRGTRPFASVGYWPRQGARGQLHVRLSGEKRDGSAVLLRIDDRTFQLVGRGWDAWAPDARADAELVAAMRTGVAMVVETRSIRGGLVRDQYRLRGAPSAVDAAALACAGR